MRMHRPISQLSFSFIALFKEEPTNHHRSSTSNALPNGSTSVRSFRR